MDLLMRPTRKLAPVALLGLALRSSPVDATAGAATTRIGDLREQGTPPDVVCVRFWGEARYIVGYDHIVYVVNDCENAASCIVWTDVSPELQSAIVPPHQTVAILTYRGSPASVFTPFARCAR
jgi:hypothetical protein